MTFPPTAAGGDAWQPDEAPYDPAREAAALAAFAAATGHQEPAPAPEPSDDPNERPLFVDIPALLDGTLPDPPKPDLLVCSDGHSLFYRGQLNHIYGDPESGKTWVCLAAVAADLTNGRRAAVIDVDHNGAPAILHRLRTLGASDAAMRDRLRFAEPEDGHELIAVVRALVEWSPDVVVVDSLGEVLPLFGASSNSPDDYTRVHALVMKPLARSGAAVLAVDHLAKSETSRAMGATGTAAKKRSIGGVSLRATVGTPFAPGKGGTCFLAISKDRHGGLREHRAGAGDKEPVAGVFRLHPDGSCTVDAPKSTDRNPAEAAPPEDVAAVAALDPPPRNVREARERLSWNMTRASRAVVEWKQQTGQTR